MKRTNIPIQLTLIRLVISPLVLPLLLVYLLPYHSLWINVSLALLFALLSITDFFDGYLARRYNQETLIGKILDPLADKFLISSALIALLAAGKIYFYWVIILIGRELFVMGLRHAAVECQFTVPVSKLGKLKTAAQMLCIMVIILNPYQPLGVAALNWNGAEMGLLLITIVLSLISAEQYYDDFMEQFTNHTTKPISYKEIPYDDTIG